MNFLKDLLQKSDVIKNNKKIVLIVMFPMKSKQVKACQQKNTVYISKIKLLIL